MSSAISNLRGFRLLFMRESGRHPLRSGLAVLALAAGVTMTVVAGLLLSSFDNSYRAFLHSFAGPTEIRVSSGARDQSWLTPRDVERIASVRGVETVAPVVHTVTTLEGRSGEETYAVAIGGDCRSAIIVGFHGCDPRAFASVTTDRPLLTSARLKNELGPSGSILTDLGRMPLASVAASPNLDRFNHGHVVIFTLSGAQHAFSRGQRYDEVFVKTKRSYDVDSVLRSVSRVVPRWDVALRSDYFASWQFGANGPLLPLLILVIVMSMGLAGLLVYNIVGISLAERRRDLAVAGAFGFSPRRLATGALADAAVLGALGGAVGCFAGSLLAGPLVRAASSIAIEHSLGVRASLHLAPSVLVMGMAIGIVTAVIASFVPVRRATRLDLAAELHGRAVPQEESRARSTRRLVVLGSIVGCAIGLSYLSARGGALQSWQPTVGALSLLVTAVSVFALAGALAPRLVSILRRTRSTGPRRLAFANLTSRGTRTAAIASAVASAVGIACVLGMLVFAIRSVVGDTFGRDVDGRVWVSTIASVNDSGSTTRIPKDILSRLRRLPYVAEIDTSRCVRDSDATAFLQLCSVTGMRRPPVRVLSGTANQSVVDRGETIVAEGVARTRKLHVGSMLRISTGSGYRQIRVAGIWANPNYNGYVATVSNATLERLFGAGPAGIAMVRPARGTSADQLAREIRAAHIDPDVHALSPTEMTHELSIELGQQVAPFWIVQRMLLFVALVATLSMFLLIGVVRRRELGILGAVGFGPGGLGSMTMTEALTIGVLSAALGVLGGVGLFVAFSNVAVASIGTKAPIRFATSTALTSSLLAVIVVALGGVLPSWRTSRLQIVDAIRNE